MATALDYLDSDRIFLCVESMRIRERIKNYTTELTEDMKSLLEEGILAPQQMVFCATWEDYLAKTRAHSCVLLESFIGSGLEPRPREILTVSAKQLPSYGGSLETALSDIRHYEREHYTVYVLASSEQRAKNLAELLAHEGIRAELDYDAMEMNQKAALLFPVVHFPPEWSIRRFVWRY